MSAFKPQQRHLTVRDRAFHFVSYEAIPENLSRNQPSQPAMWYLMVAGRRFPAMPFLPDTPLPEVDRQLARWAESNALGAPVVAEPAIAPSAKRRATWWGPN